MITDDELKRWAELCEGATAGPWRAGRSDMVLYQEGGPVKNIYGPRVEKHHHVTGDPLHETVATANGDTCIESANFIAAARDAMPRLIAEVERLRAAVSVIASEVTKTREHRAAKGMGCADDELKRWADRYREAFETEEDNNRTDELVFALVAECAMPRLIAEVAHLKNKLGHDAQCAEQFRDENTALKAEVERLEMDNIKLRNRLVSEHDHSTDAWLRAAILEKENRILKSEAEYLRRVEDENTALKAEMERLRGKPSLAEVRAKHGFADAASDENREQNLFDIEAAK